MEVNKFDIVLDLRDKDDVLWLEVHVDDLLVVQVGNCAEHLCDDLSGILL